MNSRLLPLALMAMVGLTASAAPVSPPTYEVLLAGFVGAPDLAPVIDLNVTGLNVFDVLTHSRLISSSQSGTLSGTLPFTGSGDDLNLAIDAATNPTGPNVQIYFTNTSKESTYLVLGRASMTGSAATIDRWHFQMSQGTPPMETFFISFTGEASFAPQ